MADLLNLISKEDRERLKKRFSNSLNREKQKDRITPEIYMLSEFGYYYGWEAILAVRKNEITMPEMFALLEGARKVWYAKLVDSANASRVAMNSANAGNARDAKQAFESGMKHYRQRAEVER